MTLLEQRDVVVDLASTRRGSGPAPTSDFSWDVDGDLLRDLLATHPQAS